MTVAGIGLTTTLGGLNGSVNETTAAAHSARTGQTTNTATSAVKDQTSVSTAGGLVAQALSTSDVRLDKVSALQTAIASRTYNVPSSEVASKIVDSLLR